MAVDSSGTTNHGVFADFSGNADDLAGFQPTNLGSFLGGVFRHVFAEKLESSLDFFPIDGKFTFEGWLHTFTIVGDSHAACLVPYEGLALFFVAIGRCAQEAAIGTYQEGGIGIFGQVLPVNRAIGDQLVAECQG